MFSFDSIIKLEIQTMASIIPAYFHLVIMQLDAGNVHYQYASYYKRKCASHNLTMC